jgi:hypothetical protein
MTVPFPDITDDLKKTLETFTAEYNAMGHKNTKVERIKYFEQNSPKISQASVRPLIKHPR